MKKSFMAGVAFVIGVLVAPVAGQTFSDIAGEKNKSPEKTGDDSEFRPDTSYTDIFGAFRLNYMYTNYEGKRSPLGTAGRNEFTWDTWRLGVNAYSKGVELSFEYRFYPTFNTHFIHHGWLGYHFNSNTNIQLGISQVPFGDLPFASHSWWFQIPYYVGLEDDYQIGFRLEHQQNKWLFHLAYYLMAEPRGTSEASYGTFEAARYSYDVVPVEGNTNIERNQINGRMEYHPGNLRAGLSVQWLQIYNQSIEHTGHQVVLGGHINWDIKKWNFKAQAIYYNYRDVRNDQNEVLNVVQMGAYGFGTYDVAAEASIVSAGLAYTLPVKLGPVFSIQLYNDFSLVSKYGEVDFYGVGNSFEKSMQNVLGALLTAGKIYTYVDLASGYNHPWLSGFFGGNALGSGYGERTSEPVSAENPINRSGYWNTRLNINIGYYF